MSNESIYFNREEQNKIQKHASVTGKTKRQILNEIVIVGFRDFFEAPLILKDSDVERIKTVAKTCNKSPEFVLDNALDIGLALLHLRVDDVRKH
ncbi:MAG: hypothetical protein NWF01_08765 [Candidatus Bathyarchaeota archaeon]|nr:hypothetical protein [Candidatus Bathyarchaeota archaeon]